MSTITKPDPTSTDTPTPQAQAGHLLTQVAGYMAVRIIDIGSRSGLLQALAATPGATADELSERLELDPFYVSVWCRGAFGAGVLERVGAGFALAPHLETLLLNPGSPAYVGGLFPLVQQPEMFGLFDAHLASGLRLWWDETSPDWIAGVAATGRPFYTRLIPGGLAQVDGLTERLEAGCRVLDTSCGSGTGLIRLAKHYPRCTNRHRAPDRGCGR